MLLRRSKNVIEHELASAQLMLVHAQKLGTRNSKGALFGIDDPCAHSQALQD
jgi:nitrite reductase/ring-hydroxylating ferredoxin subunit